MKALVILELDKHGQLFIDATVVTSLGRVGTANIIDGKVLLEYYRDPINLDEADEYDSVFENVGQGELYDIVTDSETITESNIARILELLDFEGETEYIYINKEYENEYEIILEFLNVGGRLDINRV